MDIAATGDKREGQAVNGSEIHLGSHVTSEPAHDKNDPLVGFCRTAVEPDEPILLNEKCLRKGGIFHLNGGPCWIRTSDQLVKSQLLYQLS